KFLLKRQLEQARPRFKKKNPTRLGERALFDWSGWRDWFRPAGPARGPEPPSDRTLGSHPALKTKSPTNVELFLSGWRDSNPRPPAPHAGAIPGYATTRLGVQR